MSEPIRVLFVCLGNICRSPTAEGVFRHLLTQQGLADRVAVDSCGTGSWHIGKAPDERARQAAASRSSMVRSATGTPPGGTSPPADQRIAFNTRRV